MTGLNAAERSVADALRSAFYDGAFDPAADNTDEGIGLAARAVVAAVRGPMYREAAAHLSAITNHDGGQLRRAHGQPFVTGLLHASTLVYRAAHRVERDGVGVVAAESPPYLPGLAPCSECVARQADPTE